MRMIALIAAVIVVPLGCADPPKPRIILWRNAVESVNAASDAHLTAVDPETKKLVRLTKNADEGVPTFPIVISPDGKLVAYTKSDIDGEYVRLKVFVRSLDDAKSTGRSLDVDGFCTCWSHDGKQVIVASQSESGYEHHQVDVKSREKKSISLPKIGTSHPLITDWARDGQWFLATSITVDNGQEKRTLHLIKSDGSESKSIRGAESGSWGRFSPDGKRVLFTAPDDKNQSRLFAVDAAGGKPIRLSPELDGQIDEAGFCWSPDGKRAAYLWLNTDRPQIGQEYEMFLMVVDADGRNEVTVHGEKSQLSKPLRFPQWK